MYCHELKRLELEREGLVREFHRAVRALLVDDVPFPIAQNTAQAARILSERSTHAVESHRIVHRC